MRYPASEKLEIIRLVEQSYLPIKQTLDKLGIPRTTFYRWYDRYQIGGPEALEDRSPRPSRVWNRIPDDVRQRIVEGTKKAKVKHQSEIVSLRNAGMSIRRIASTVNVSTSTVQAALKRDRAHI